MLWWWWCLCDYALCVFLISSLFRWFSRRRVYYIRTLRLSTLYKWWQISVKLLCVEREREREEILLLENSKMKSRSSVLCSCWASIWIIVEKRGWSWVGEYWEKGWSIKLVFCVKVEIQLKLFPWWWQFFSNFYFFYHHFCLIFLYENENGKSLFFSLTLMRRISLLHSWKISFSPPLFHLHSYHRKN